MRDDRVSAAAAKPAAQHVIAGELRLAARGDKATGAVLVQRETGYAPIMSVSRTTPFLARHVSNSHT